MSYPELVRQHFFAPRNVGPLPPVPGAQRLRGEAGSAAGGAWVVVEADVHGPTVRRMAFRAQGSPYLIAACSLVTERLTGRDTDAARQLDPLALAAEIEAPAEQWGGLLVLQDALRNCFADWDTTQPAAAR